MSAPLLRANLGAAVVWSLYEYRWNPAQRRVEKVLVQERRNLLTNYGLTALAGAFQGSYTAAGYAAPNYLVIESGTSQIQNVGGLAVAATSMSLNTDPTLAGDTQLVLGVGTANQETVSFSAKTGTGPYTFTISATTKTHAQNDYVSRAVVASDDSAQIQSEVQFDSTGAPNQRLQTIGGFSPNTASWTVQFFVTGTQAIAQWLRLGMADSLNLGNGHLHNHLVFGYNHVSGADVEVDASLTLSNV